MRHKLLDLFCGLGFHWARHIFIISLSATVLLGMFMPHLKVSNSHSDLLPSKHPEQVRYLEFLREFGAADNIVVILDGEPDALKASADSFARELASEKKYVKNVFYRIDMDLLIKSAPLFLPKEKLEEVLSFLSTNESTVRTISDIDGIPSLLDVMGKAMGGKLSGISVPPVYAPGALERVRIFFDQWLSWIDDPTLFEIDHARLLADIGETRISSLESKEFLLSHDESLLFIFVQPQSSSDDISHLRPQDKALREACQRVFDSQPGLSEKVKVAFTGMPSHVLTEIETIREDVGRAGVISIFLVVAILLFIFRSFKTMLIAIIPLGCGMIMTLGIATITVGHLNLVSAAFLAVLFGIGIDFAIYLIKRTEEELRNGQSKEEAVRIAITISGKGVITGGLSTSMAFFAEGYSDFIGFSELGIVAGIGVLVVMVTTFLMLPALLLHMNIKPREYRHIHTADCRWLKAERRLLYPLVTLALVFAGIGVFALNRMSFDFNALGLLPPDSESTIYQLRMQDESDFQMTFAAVTAESLDELRELEKEIENQSTVSRIDSLSRIIPTDQTAKIALLRKCREFLPDAQFAVKEGRCSRKDYVAALDNILNRFEVAQEDAFAAGQAAIVEKIDDNIAVIEDIKRAFSHSNMAVDRTMAFEKEFFAKLATLAGLVKEWGDISYLDESSLPPGMISRFKSKKGNYVAFVFPKGSVWDVEFVDRFIADLRGITENVTGFPATTRVNTRLAVNGLRQSLIYGLVIIVVLLALDFKKIHAVLLSLIPLVVGMLWLQAALMYMGLEYNLASMAGLPLLLGLGVVYGVHIVHRWQENPGITAFAATVTSGRGVAFAAFTTAAGLFSIIFSRHKGVSDFGIILFQGILSCLAASLVILPTVIDLFFLKPEVEKIGKHENQNDIISGHAIVPASVTYDATGSYRPVINETGRHEGWPV